MGYACLQDLVNACVAACTPFFDWMQDHKNLDATDVETKTLTQGLKEASSSPLMELAQLCKFTHVREAWASD